MMENTWKNSNLCQVKHKLKTLPISAIYNDYPSTFPNIKLIFFREREASRIFTSTLNVEPGGGQI